MTARVITGSQVEIARQVAGLQGEVRKAIVFVDDPAAATPVPASVEEMFHEMEPFVVQRGGVDDSREGVYRRKPGK